MGKNFVCGLDIGTFKICATCGIVDSSGKVNILASYTLPAQGVKVGRVIDSRKLSACIREIQRKLYKMCGIKVQRVYINIDSPDLRAKLCQKKVSFGQHLEIRKKQIEKLINSAVCSNVPLNRKVIHTGFRNFSLDNQFDSIYPEGLFSREMKLNIVIVSALIPTINSFIKCIKDSGLILEDLVPSGCAQALGLFRNFKPSLPTAQVAPLPRHCAASERGLRARAGQGLAKVDTEKDNILLDIGAGLSKITFFKNRLVKGIAILPLGAQSITEDIAIKLKISGDSAEQLKIKYGRVYCEDRLLNQKFIVKDKLTSKVIQLERLHGIIASKVDYLLQEIKKALLELNCQDEKVARIIVTGGGSILEGFLERAEKILGKPVKMGFLYSVNDSHIQAQSGLYATSIGLIHFGFKNKDKKSFYGRKRIAPFMRTLNRARFLYHEYF